MQDLEFRTHRNHTFIDVILVADYRAVLDCIPVIEIVLLGRSVSGSIKNVTSWLGCKEFWQPYVTGAVSQFIRVICINAVAFCAGFTVLSLYESQIALSVYYAETLQA